jgi:hypothetical protein
MASGKPPMYRYHVRTEFAHVYIGKGAGPGKSPNVYVSLGALHLWHWGLDACVERLSRIIVGMGGVIQAITPSRCDPCVDLRIPEDLSFDFIKRHLVSHTRDLRQFESDGRLETFYLGDPKNPIQLRIYDKGRKALEDQSSFVFREVWKTDDLNHIWRIEFQIRRPFLHEQRINSIEDLKARLGSLWAYLTDRWCSLRLDDDINTTRRTVHPGWKKVQECATRFGKIDELSRARGALVPASPEWHLAHIGGCMTSFAALTGFDSWQETLRELAKRLENRKPVEDYEQEIKLKRVKLGRQGLPIRGTYQEGWDEQ